MNLVGFDLEMVSIFVQVQVIFIGVAGLMLGVGRRQYVLGMN